MIDSHNLVKILFLAMFKIFHLIKNSLFWQEKQHMIVIIFMSFEEELDIKTGQW